ncbi:MAG: flagellar rod assembly protein/muramidase FlgJ [Burkholderiales bacterium RIFCSPHIGHO2_01_FULL_63_240]|jgi:flagellar protein FlgJ|nr:MAG: flagellar rod assembly protein/muramidase FlgJ [Burkholderiales bacterium RIFCSPHIGHO2_01_FULL_63_240]
MSVNNPAATNGLTMDLRSLDRLKGTSGTNPRAAVRETAKQLESLFMGELMKSMRASTMSSGMFENSGSEMATGMLDTQFAGQMSGRPGGLADAIAKQLERQMGIKPETADKSGATGGTTASASTLSRVAGTNSFKGLGQLGDLGDLDATQFPGGNGADLEEILRRAQSLDRGSARTNTASNATTTSDGKRLSNSEQFIRKHHEAAKAAEAASGIPSGHILGQAALESGWGKHEIKMKDGSSSHNLFGIKATSDWKGKVAEVTTTEYIGGVARKVTAKFRAYDSYADAFKDHARLLTQSPRYSQTVAKADTAQGYAQGLQKAGYATDPAYANKLTQVINTALRVQRSMA